MRKKIFSILMMAGALVAGTTALSSCGNEDNFWTEAVHIYGQAVQGNEAYLETGATMQLRATNGFLIHGTGFRWESSNPAVATVSDSGLITAVSEGTAVITVYTTGDAVINKGCITVYVSNKAINIGSGNVDQSAAE